MKSLVAFSFIFCLSCTSTANRFILSEEVQEEFTLHFQKKKIKPLKKEWRELYNYAKNGHILKSPNRKGLISSIEFYRYFNREHYRIFDIPFFQHYDNLLTFFGKPDSVTRAKGRVHIVYYPSLLNDTCDTCTRHGIGFVFDSETMTLLKE